MMFETSKYVPKTEKRCCVFKDNCYVFTLKNSSNIVEKVSYDLVFLGIKFYLKIMVPLLILQAKKNNIRIKSIAILYFFPQQKHYELCFKSNNSLYIVYMHYLQVNTLCDNSRAMSALTFLVFKLNTLQTKIVKL